jgi:hypothetical protein
MPRQRSSREQQAIHAKRTMTIREFEKYARLIRNSGIPKPYRDYLIERAASRVRD